ncbi:integral membrane mpv17 pmp22 [Colletotrichum truncatum]|uniref:Integral membrane mpv17 pmp22 n=1 Tax=Colletotrichum truncatum TaxID=5467 RepID=A0ACC3YHQ2_COLTU|nr:integral membrane mpv17 pmp22 [Colletotrichum truncatum]KAF6792743.1 integral membrane mpv17 pmp22 [Colletotrichum truncatum]
MPSLLATAVQSATLKASANFTAQIVNQHRQAGAPPLDWRRVAEFATFGFIQGHINYWWQHFLEDRFPNSATRSAHKASSSTVEKGEAKPEKPEKPVIATKPPGGKNYFNVARKLVIDQTLGLFIMNSAFLIITSILRTGSAAITYQIWSERIFDLIKAAWKLWPLVAFCNFAFVPVGYRALVGMTVGFAWNMFLTFFLL